jgi:TRAP-type C4-dicarboxylate transport system permease small subunit
MFVLKSMVVTVVGLFFAVSGWVWVERAVVVRSRYTDFAAYEWQHSVALLLVAVLALFSSLAVARRLFPKKAQSVDA